MAESKGERPKGASDSRLYAAIAVVVVTLAILVWWSLPPEIPPAALLDGGPSSTAVDDPPTAKTTPTQLERSVRAAAELVVLTDKPEATIEKALKRDAIAGLLDVRHCGATCGALKAFVLDEHGFEAELMRSEEYILPPKDTLDTVAPGLTPDERGKAASKPFAVVVRTQAPFSTDHLAARAAFAATVALAEALDGYVYDEISRRIETRREFAEQVITVPLGQQPVFKPRQIVVQLYRQGDETARLLTLGMVRFGLPDFTARGSNMSAGPQIANVINAVASLAVAGRQELPIVVTIDDVAKALGRTPADLGVDPMISGPVSFTVGEPERTEGDPDNELVELIPPGGATREGWDAALSSLFGGTQKTVRTELDKPLATVAANARKSVGAAIARFQKGEGRLFLKSSFAVPIDARGDGGPATESLWVQIASCDERTCAGSISNSPEYATNLAYGKTTTVTRAEILDWLLELRDGTKSGGESIKLLQHE
jgi:uncharacterized protein YegJ (DUF2314 family)